MQLLVLLCALLSQRGVWAQAAIEDSLPLSDDPSDPIGIDREPLPVAAESSKPEKPVSPSQARYGPEPPPLSAQVGEALTATASVRERTHKVAVELSSAMARVQLELELENAADKPAEVAYRVPVPADAALFALEVCNANGCRPGLPHTSSARLNAYDDAVQARPGSTRGLPAGDARMISDARGPALLLRAAPVSRSHWLRIRVTYAAAASEHAGHLRFSLPARGMDPRIAPAQLSAQAPGFAELRANDMPLGQPLELEPWSAVELHASGGGRAARSELWKVPCGAHSCLRAYATAPPEPTVATEIFLAIDASPSTEGEARSRFLASVSALLAAAPSGSHVRALRFASQAVPLLAERKPARELALSAFAPVAFEAELGSATRFEAAWQLIERSAFMQARAKKLVVILGDGGLTTGPARPFEAARRKGVEVAVLNVSDRATSAALARGAQLTGGAVIDAGKDADRAARGADLERLEERVAALFQPSRGLLQVAGPRGFSRELRAGDSIVWEGAAKALPGVRLGSRSLSAHDAPRALSPAIAAHAWPAPRPLYLAVDRSDLQLRAERPEGQDAPAQRGVACDRRGPAQRISGLSSDAAPVQLAQERARCAEPVPKPRPQSDAEPELGAGMPGSPLLSMLRQRILPMARGCFRRDRAGRADYQVRAVFEFELADREVVAASVQGKIAEELRSCLLRAVDGLLVPRFTGKVVVRYPLVTEREPLPSQVELTAATAEEVDTLIGKP